MDLETFLKLDGESIAELYHVDRVVCHEFQSATPKFSLRHFSKTESFEDRVLGYISRETWFLSHDRQFTYDGIFMVVLEGKYIPPGKLTPRKFKSGFMGDWYSDSTINKLVRQYRSVVEPTDGQIKKMLKKQQKRLNSSDRYAQSTEEMRGRLEHLERYLHSAPDFVFEFARFMAPIMHPTLEPSGFYLALQFAIHDIQMGNDTVRDMPVPDSLRGQSSIVYFAMREMIPQIAQAACPPDYAEKVRTFAESVDK